MSQTDDLARRVEAAIRHVPDFPFEGFPFREVTPILEDDPARHCIGLPSWPTRRCCEASDRIELSSRGVPIKALASLR